MPSFRKNVRPASELIDWVAFARDLRAVADDAAAGDTWAQSLLLMSNESPTETIAGYADGGVRQIRREYFGGPAGHASCGSASWCARFLRLSREIEARPAA